MFLRKMQNVCRPSLQSMWVLLFVSAGFTASGQLTISGPKSVIMNNAYTYSPMYNGSGTYSCSGSYSYIITGGVVTGTTSTSKSGTCSGIVYSMSISITWTSASGSLYLSSGLGSSSINVNALSALQPGVLSPSSQNINYGTPAAITATAATGGAVAPVYSYQWMSSPDGVAWTDISGATVQPYTPPALFTSTYYRRRVTEKTSSNVYYTNTVFIDVYKPVTCTISPSMQHITAGTASATLTATRSGGNGVYNYQWQYSRNTISWSNIATTISYNPGVIDSTAYYRLVITSNGVSVTSNIATVSTCAPTDRITGPTQCAVGSTIQLSNITIGGTWSSSDVNIASINATGVVTGKQPGAVTITYIKNSACGTSVMHFALTVVPLQTGIPGVGTGVQSPRKIDTILLTQGNSKINEYCQDFNSEMHSIKNVIAFQLIEESKKYIPGNFIATAVVQLEYGHSATEIYKIDSIKLTVTYNKNEGIKHNALNYFTFNNAEHTRVTLLRIDAPVTVAGVAFDTRQVLLLTNTLAATRYYKLADNKRPELYYNASLSDAVPDTLPVAWTLPASTNNNGMQLEWAWLENELHNAYVVNNVFDTSLLFKASSTRIDLAGGAAIGDYAIPLLYDGVGKLYIRARAVNTMPSGSRSDGPWSWVQTYSFNGHHPNLNWQVTTTYAEEGKRKSVIQYYDGSLRSRQTVTKDNTTRTTLVAETFYDGQGRAAVQILPAPGISKIISYTKNLNKFNSQPDNTDPLDYFDFTTPTLGNYKTVPLDSTTGTARYYSGQNVDRDSGFNKNIPYANGYPYAVTRYTPDATGRVLRQGGVGDSLQISTSHATKYYYGTAEQEHLNALFGTEAGNYTHYFKNMVQDANGQMSVSYVDMHGRTIATALAGETSAGIQSLATADTNIYKNQFSKVLIRKLLNKNSNVLKGNSIECINSILVPFQTLYSFNYQLGSQTLQLPKCGGGTVSYPCKFDLQISVADESGDNAPAVYNYTGISSLDFRPSLLLQQGSYSVRKTLTINQDSLNKFLQQYDSVGVGICNTQQFLIDSIAAKDSLASACNITPPALTTAGCLATLGTYPTYLLTYANRLGYTSVSQLSPIQSTDIRNQYINDSSACTALNINTSHMLETIRDQMLQDMIPYNGQYAMETGAGTIYNKYNIFSPTGNPTYPQPLYRYPRQIMSGPATYYTNQFGNIDSSVLLTRLQTMTKAAFATAFKNNWAPSLLPYHPEFKKLQFAEANLRPVFNFIDSLQTYVPTAFSPITADPFFRPFSALADKNLMYKYSDTVWKGGYSMWQLAYSEAFGCKTIPDATLRQACFNNMPRRFTATGTLVNTGPAPVVLSSALQSSAWTMYKAYYAQVRSDMVYRYINTNAGTDIAENNTLIAQQYRLHFPNNSVEEAQNNGWTTWYPNQNDSYPPINMSDSAAAVSNHCDSYINAWRNALLTCPQLQNHAGKEILLNSITAKLLQVCKYGTDAANPYGSSTVAPAYISAAFKSFEQAVKFVFDSAGISYSQFCHPYAIAIPKPYGKNAKVTRQYVTTIDTCSCRRFAQLQSEISAAGEDAKTLSSINAYLLKTYQDTISKVLYEALDQCSFPYLYRCRDTTTTCYQLAKPTLCTVRICDTLYGRPLATLQALPDFMVCGFQKSNYECFNCAYFKSIDSSFQAIFGRRPVLTGPPLTNDTAIAYNVLFAQYINFKTGLQKDWRYYAERFNTTSCAVGGVAGVGNSLSICLERKPLNDTTGLTASVTPCQQVRIRATVKAAIIYEYRRQQLLANFRAAYLAQCLQVTESFKVTDTVKEYHYTLYYYDQAGNLVKTVPPKGVTPIYRQSWLDSVETAKTTGAYLVPHHSLVTRYCYNSLNQVNIQKTPDGGSSRYYYDRLGRLAVSQNAKQSAQANSYSYTRYDSLGRILQVGQITGAPMTDAIAKNANSLQTWFTNAAASRNQVTETVYDTVNIAVNGFAIYQQNLRNRVSYTQVIDNAGELPAHATIYSYDIHGNVDTLLQDYGNSMYKPNPMNRSANRFKKMVYNYDLISGKVNQVSYQPGAPDAYYHRYVYDAENRLTDVYSGRDSVMLFFFKEKEAHYTYYKHGPLAQTVLGQLQVQKADYAYTLQGWLKAVNPVMGGTLANGKDSTEPDPFAQDVYGFGLNYFKNDYKAIGFAAAGTGILGALTTQASPLFNGNIAAMAVNIPTLGAAKVYNYKYDQLNRLVAMDVFNGLHTNTGTFAPVGMNDYRERISYDANGNILTYQRNGDAARLQMDNLSYFYKPSTNQLHKVTDAAPNAAAADYSKYNDLKQGQADNNYTYDPIGNLVGDASESLSAITWSVYGKILTISKGGQQIKYVYDAAGNRIFKYTASDTTAYVRDASGNVLSVYTRSGSAVLAQSEIHLYGSARLGIKTQQTVPDTAIVLSGGFVAGGKRIFTRGEKLFELSNHLGNVLATVYDRRTPQDPDANGIIDFYKAEVASANDYYPGGMLMPGRKYGAMSRYGFNGKEQDSEVNGEGNSYDFGDRVYDPRIVRLHSVDQKSAMYPAHSPYCYAVGNPIFFIDPDGNSVEPSNLVITKERGTSKFKVTGDITIKIQVLNLSAKANNDLYIHDYVNRVKSGLTDLLNTSATVTQINDIDLQVGGKGTASNKLVSTGKVRETEWTYAFNVNVQIEVIDSKDKIRQDAHVLAIVDSYDPRPSADIEGNPMITPIGVSNGDRIATVGVSEIEGFKIGDQLHTALHEIAHSLGVSHFWNKVPGDKGKANLMDYKLRNNKLDNKQMVYEIWFNKGLTPYTLMKKFNDKKTPWSQEKEKFNTSSKEELDKLIDNGGVNTSH